MSTSANLVKWYPPLDPSIPEPIAQHLKLLYGGTNDHDQAITTLYGQVQDLAATVPTSTTTTITNTVETESLQFPGLGTRNDQTGNTAYTSQTSDNGATIFFDDSSAVTLTLNSVVATPYFFFVSNLGAGTVTLTPTSGSINGSSSLLIDYTAIVTFDGTNWWATGVQIVPVNTPGVASQWIASYDSATGVFTLSQPAIADITGLSAALALLAPLASPALTGTPTVPTASPGTNTTQAASTAFVAAADALLAPIAAPTFTGVVTQPDTTVLTAPTTATSATAGTASALPATPAGYLQINLGGTLFKIPYYAT